MNKCKHIKTNGKACQAYAMLGSDYCFIHNEDVAEKRKEAVIRGGKQKKKIIILEQIELKQIEDILPFLNKCISEIRRGELTPKAANSIGYLLGIAVDVLKLTDIERRLKEVENAIKLREKEF